MSLLELVKINKNFGGVQALDDVSLTINKGEIYGLIGPNGAGKTTLFNVITGVYLPNNGGISFDQQSIVGRKPYQVALAGIARTFQNIRLFQNMTVMENVMVGMHANTSTGSFGAIFSTKSARHEEKMIREQSAKWLSYVGILTEANNLARNLSYGDQRRLEIARALATKPKLLALDEPAAGMNATETEELKLLIQRIRNDGISILLIEHDVKLIMNLCDRVAVLDFGQKNSRRRSAACADRSESYTSLYWRRVAMSFLETRLLGVRYGGIRAVRDIDIKVEEGETVALIGANGAGKSSMLNAIAGVLPHTGKIYFNNADLTNKPVFDRVKLGISMVPEGRGVFGRLTVEENLLMGAYLGNSQQDQDADLKQMYEFFPRLKERRGQTGGTLSGGEQQMLAIARALMSRPKLLLLDEPSMGLAPIMVEKIFEVIRGVSKTGVTILLVEQNARLALESSERAYVMESGELSITGESSELLHSPKIRSSYLGEGD